MIGESIRQVADFIRLEARGRGWKLKAPFRGTMSNAGWIGTVVEWCRTLARAKGQHRPDSSAGYGRRQNLGPLRTSARGMFVAPVCCGRRRPLRNLCRTADFDVMRGTATDGHNRATLGREEHGVREECQYVAPWMALTERVSAIHRLSYRFSLSSLRCRSNCCVEDD